MYQCPNCGHRFNDQTAYCEDWRVTTKCFGCPSCKTFFRKAYPKPQENKYQVYYTLSIAIMTPFLIWPSLLGEWNWIKNVVAVNAAIAMVLAVKQYFRYPEPWVVLEPFDDES